MSERDQPVTPAPDNPSTDGPAPPGSKPAPALVAYFGVTPIRPAAFIKAIKSEKIQRFDDGDMQSAPTLMATNDADHARLCGLASQHKMPDAVNRWIWPVVHETLRTAAPKAFELHEMDTPALFGALYRHFSRPELNDAEEKRRTQNLIRIAMVWLITQRALDPAIALDQFGASRFRERSAALRKTRYALVSGKKNELEIAAAVFALLKENTRVAQAERDQERQRKVQLQDQLVAARQELDGAKRQIAALEQEKQRLAEQSNESTRRFQEGLQHWGHDMTEIKARQKALIRDRVTPLLKDALDALEIQPPAPHISVNRLKKALEVLGEAAQ